MSKGDLGKDGRRNGETGETKGDEMYSKTMTAALLGLEGMIVEVEADIRDGLPGMDMVGALGTEVREARERVRTAIINSGFVTPPKKITVNLSPSDIRKEGNGFDLAIAVSVLSAFGYLPRPEEILLLGELGLDGDVRPVRGVLPIALFAKKLGIRLLILPEENVAEARLVGEDLCVLGVRTLSETVDLLNQIAMLRSDAGTEDAAFAEELLFDGLCQEDGKEEDPFLKAGVEVEENFSSLSGQLAVRRAAEIAASGRHNLLMVGPPGSGKTMVAKRIPGILPRLTREEALEISKVHSVCGLLQADKPLICTRPFRAPHHTVTAVTLTGGGRIPKPGEISLADHGVLFLDELTEFPKTVLDTLRQPLEDGEIVVSRLQGAYRYPAHFMLVAGMNPCPCGFFPDRTRCHCSPTTVRNYLNHVSRPLLDRIDVCVEVAPVKFEELQRTEPAESSEAIRERVWAAQKVQERRFAGESFSFNSAIPASRIEEYCTLGKAEKELMEQVYRRMGLSARGYHKILKVARTIADLDGEERIHTRHLSEAVGYRTIEQKFWEGSL